MGDVLKENKIVNAKAIILFFQKTVSQSVLKVLYRLFNIPL